MLIIAIIFAFLRDISRGERVRKILLYIRNIFRGLCIFFVMGIVFYSCSVGMDFYPLAAASANVSEAVQSANVSEVVQSSNVSEAVPDCFKFGALYTSLYTTLILTHIMAVGLLVSIVVGSIYVFHINYDSVVHFFKSTF